MSPRAVVTSTIVSSTLLSAIMFTAVMLASAVALTAAAQDAASSAQAEPKAAASSSDQSPSAGNSSTATASGAAPSGDAASQPTSTPFPDLTIPPQADRKALEQIVKTAKGLQPKDLAQYRAMQTAIRDASNQLLKVIDDKTDPVRQQAELDSLTSSAALMVNDTEEKREEVLDHILTYLEDRKELTLNDVQTGMVVAFYLEMQPHKTPARDVYALIDERLENDPRDEMKALRLNLQANIRRLEMLGQKFELDAQSIAGKQIKTDDFAGKFVLVDFFASWCVPCIEEVPRIQRHYAKYREKGLEVIAISIDDDRQALDKYLDDKKLPWPVIHDDATDPKEKLQIRFGISSLPYVLLLNKEGVVVSLEARGAELDRLMERIFEEPTPAEPVAPNQAVKPSEQKPSEQKPDGPAGETKK